MALSLVWDSDLTFHAEGGPALTLASSSADAYSPMQLLAHAIMACDQSSSTPNITAQPHRVLTGIPGEYSANDCIPTNASILYHMPLNKRGGYSQPKLENGVFRVAQTGYSIVEPVTTTRSGF